MGAASGLGLGGRGKGRGQDRLVDYYAEFAEDWPVIAAGYVDIGVVDALAVVVGVAGGGEQDAVAPRWHSALLFCVGSGCLLQFVGREKANLTLLVIGEEDGAIGILLVQTKLIPLN